MDIGEELEKEFGFNTVPLIKTVNTKSRKNKKANGIHKYLKTYLKIYSWQERENIIISFTFDKINPETGKVINKMKQRYNYIQDHFDTFVTFLKNKTKSK